jgi:predicted adenylyl cyclase CyaB
MLKYQDCTLKARIQHVDAITHRLIDLGAQYLGLDMQHDTYFEVPNGKLKYRKGTLGTLITHYERTLVDQVEKTQVYRYDINPSEEELKQLHMNFKVIGETQKSRTLYQFDNLTIHLDELPDGQSFIEVEAKDFDNTKISAELQMQCLELFARMGISESDCIPTGYLIKI